MQSVCSNCGTAQGPFTRRVVPGAPLCYNPNRDKPEDNIKVVKACNQRRAKVDKGNDPNG